MDNKANLFNTVKNKTGRADVQNDIGLSNPDSNTSFVLSSEGVITISANEFTQYKIDKNTSGITENSLSKTTNTVMKEINAKDITINKHKFNNQLVDLTDFRNVNGNIIGNIMLNGTVLVKTWEPNLERWVLIRRPISTAMFSNRLNIPNAPEQYELDLNIMEDLKKYYTDKDK